MVEKYYSTGAIPRFKEVKAYIVVKDINEEKRKALAMEVLANRDALTGILNRSSFIQQVTAFLHSSPTNARHAMLILDLDGFKNINDTYGHIEGERFLISTAQNIKSLLREDDLFGPLAAMNL